MTGDLTSRGDAETHGEKGHAEEKAEVGVV